MLGVVKSVEFIWLDLNGLTSKSANLTKGQDINNCVPFVTQRQMTSGRYYPDEWMCDVYFSAGPIITAEHTDTASRIYLHIYVVEFDPNKVRVQQNSFNIPNNSGVTDTLPFALIDRDRAALVIEYRMSSGAPTESQYWALGAYLHTNKTDIVFTRNAGGGSTLAGHYYVFESLDGTFTTQHFTMVMNATNYDDQTITTVDLNKSWIATCSQKSTRNHAAPSDTFTRVKFKNSGAVECDRRGSTSAITIYGQVVEHHDDTVVYRGQFDFTAPSTNEQAALPATVNEDYAAAIPTMRDGMCRDDSGISFDYDRAFAMQQITTNGTTIDSWRATGTDNVNQRWQVIEFAPAPGYYFGGYVTELGSPAVRTVRAYHRDTGELLGETTSSGVGGYYYLETTYSGEQYIVALDADTDPTFNLLGYDLMVPTTISGG